MKKPVYMIGNAHLDPVWLWTWHDGFSEVKATFRSALDRMKETSDFIFTCSAACYYEWIEQACPDMFEEIKQRIAEGRWILAGGMYIQPDCNIPSGEGFVRQIMVAQRYFKEKFGVTAKVGYNVDSFGHNMMLPQILKKSGLDYYTFMRPEDYQKELPSNIFKWQAPDGSTVNAVRICFPYCQNFASAEELQEIIDKCKTYYGDYDFAACYYGVGNHGGGPTKRHLKLIGEHNADENADENLVFSSINDLFAVVDAHDAQLPVVADELEHVLKGIYLSLSKIKSYNRRCECETVAAEKFAAMSAWLTDMKYPAEAFKRAWKNTAFVQFHDSMGGCSIKPAYDSIFHMSEETLAIADRERNMALQRIAYNADTSFKDPASALVIFNSLGFDADFEIHLNPHLLTDFKKYPDYTSTIYDYDGSEIKYQMVSSDSALTQPGNDFLVNVRIPAYGYRVFHSDHDHPIPYEFTGKVSASDRSMENEFTRVDIAVDGSLHVFDKVNGRSVTGVKGILPGVWFDKETAWGHDMVKYDQPLGFYRVRDVKLLENGPIRASFEITYEYENSELVQIVSLNEASADINVHVKMMLNDGLRVTRLCVNTNVENGVSVAEIPFGYKTKPADAGYGEDVCQRYCALSGDYTVALINDSKYSYEVDGKDLYLSFARTVCYANHGVEAKREDWVFTDLGLHEFNYRITWSNELDTTALTQKADILNNPPVVLLEGCHEGKLPRIMKGINISDDRISLSALKHAEDGSGAWVMRVYDNSGKGAEGTIDFVPMNMNIPVKLSAYEVKTLRIDENGVKEVMLTEFDIV